VDGNRTGFRGSMRGGGGHLVALLDSVASAVMLAASRRGTHKRECPLGPEHVAQKGRILMALLLRDEQREG
jgi:hypothetical protein